MSKHQEKTRNDQTTSGEVNQSRRGMALALLGTFGGAALLTGCADGALDESSPYDPEDDDAITGKELALSGSTDIFWFDVYAELRAVAGGNTGTSINIAVGREGGIGGLFAWSTDLSTPDNGGTVIVTTHSPRAGCWKRVYRGPINAAWFGAAPAASGIANSTAIQNAISAVPESGTLVLPGGTLDIEAGLIIAKNMDVDGGGTTLSYTGSDVALTFYRGGSLYTWNNVKDLRIRGNSSATRGVVAEKLITSTWTSVDVSGFTKVDAVGVELRGATGNRFYNLSAVGNYVQINFTTGFSSGSSVRDVPANENKFFGGRAVDGTGPAAIRAHHSSGLKPGNQNGFHGFWIENNAGFGIDIDYAFAWTIFDCRFENNTSSNIRIRNTYGASSLCLGTRILSNGFTSVMGTPVAHIELDGNHVRTAIVGNDFDSASTTPPWSLGANVKAVSNNQYTTSETCHDVIVASSVSSASIASNTLRGRRLTIGTGDESDTAGGHLMQVISAGVVTWDRSNSWLRVDTESGAPTDDLNTIYGGKAGDMLILMAQNFQRDVVVKHGVGNIYCGADFTLTHSFDAMMLINDGFGRWMCISKQDNLP